MSELVVAAAATGAGKTLVTRSLCSALRRAGRRVQPYKIGPDYIDGRLTSQSAGRDAFNVDLWLDGADGVQRHVATTRGDADTLVFEGMMGLYDGDDESTTSTAHVAMLLDVPVLLILDGWTASQSLGAVALGLRAYEPRVRFAGAVLNRAGGAGHVRAVAAACTRAGVPLLATIPYDPAAASFERGLGLDRADAEARAAVVDRIGDVLAEQLDLDALLPPAPVQDARRSTTAPAWHARIAVAEDEAFWFTYPETLVALRAAGADPVPFSPLHDATLPPGIDGVWLGGGYPELHAGALAANAEMRKAVRQAVHDGVPFYAECGGMMYLAETLATEAGTFEMCGALKGATSIAQPALTIGYRRAVTLAESALDEWGAAVRGYEFRYASGTLHGPAAYAFEDGTAEGVALPSLTASFLHRHFLVGDDAIERFVECCAR